MKWLILLIMLVALAVLGAWPVVAQPDDVRGMVYIPRLNLVRPITTARLMDRTYDLTDLGDGVAWLEGTAWLDLDWARIVLAGHTPGAFEDIRDLRRGDAIVIWDAHAVEVYYVTGTRVVSARDVSWLMPTAGETLLLLTCEGERRFVVQAQRGY